MAHPCFIWSHSALSGKQGLGRGLEGRGGTAAPYQNLDPKTYPRVVEGRGGWAGQKSPGGMKKGGARGNGTVSRSRCGFGRFPSSGLSKGKKFHPGTINPRAGFGDNGTHGKKLPAVECCRDQRVCISKDRRAKLLITGHKTGGGGRGLSFSVPTVGPADPICPSLILETAHDFYGSAGKN